jgi:Protein of unknown function (DUF3105)
MAKPRDKGERRRTKQRHAARSRWRQQAWTASFVVGGLVLAILGLRAAGVFEPPGATVDLNAARVASGETIGTKISDQGNTHIPDSQHFSYNSVPPTSGSHWQSPTSWGIKDSQEPNERTTHNLEHGGIVIAYNPTLATDDVNRLKALVRGVSGTYRKIVLEPYVQLTDAAIAITAWDWILKLQSYDETQLAKFLNAHYQGKDAPEPNQP